MGTQTKITAQDLKYHVVKTEINYSLNEHYDKLMEVIGMYTFPL